MYSSVGWRLGLQAVTGSLVFTFFLGSCYRSASLYHPQRRAIIHLKNQKRKVCKNEFFPYAMSKTTQAERIDKTNENDEEERTLFSLVFQICDLNFHEICHVNVIPCQREEI
jgi:hypothetical protein